MQYTTVGYKYLSTEHSWNTRRFAKLSQHEHSICLPQTIALVSSLSSSSIPRSSFQIFVFNLFMFFVHFSFIYCHFAGYIWFNSLCVDDGRCKIFYLRKQKIHAVAVQNKMDNNKAEGKSNSELTVRQSCQQR